MTLKEVRVIDKEIHRLKSRLGSLESNVYSTTPKMSDSPPSGDMSDKIGKTVAEIADLNTEIQALQFRRDLAINKLDLQKYEDNCLYMFLKCKMSWAKIAAKVGSTPDSVKMMCHRYIW